MGADRERSDAVNRVAGSGRTAFVTGAAGFVGRWLCRALLEEGWTVVGLSVVAEDVAVGQASAPRGGADRQPSDIRWYFGDVRDGELLARILNEARPDAVFHLAGVSFVPSADADPGEAYDINVTATARLLGLIASRKAAGELDPAVLIVGSAEQYGSHPESELPLTEAAEQRPMGVYAATKAAQEIAALQRWRKDGVRVIPVRPFNHSGAGQSSRFLLPALVKRALELRATGGRVLSIGNTTPVRDISHVAEVVRAYILLAERGVPGTAYNVCSGRGYSVADLASRVLERAGVRAELQPDPSLVRSADVPALVGSPARIAEATGWAPTRTLDDLIDDLIHAATH